MLKLCDITRRANGIKKEFEKIVWLSNSKEYKNHTTKTRIKLNRNDIIEIDELDGDTWNNLIKVSFLDGEYHTIINNMPGSVWSEKVMLLFEDYLTDYYAETTMRMYDSMKIAFEINKSLRDATDIVASHNNTATNKVNVNFANNSSIQVMIDKSTTNKPAWETLTYIRYADGSFAPARNKLHPLDYSWMMQITANFNDMIAPLYDTNNEFFYEN